MKVEGVVFGWRAMRWAVAEGMVVVGDGKG
jgi:hypothetical protein